MANYVKANEYVRNNTDGITNYPELWDSGKFSMIANDKVATKLLDMAQIYSVEVAIKMLQEVLNEPLEDGDERFLEDGKMTRRIADAVSMECKFQGGEFALLSALVGALEKAITGGNEAVSVQYKPLLARAVKLP